MDEIDNLVVALESLRSPFLEARRPGLSPDELRAEVRRHMPEWWAGYVDDDVSAWYGWQNGADPDAEESMGESGRASVVITPDGLTLKGIHEMLVPAVWEIAGTGYARDLGIVFPLGPLDSTAGNLFLHKSNADDEWRVWELTVGYDLQELESAGEFISPPTFREWLSALAEAIDSGRLILGRHGNVAVPGEGIERTKLHSYPWEA